MKKRIHDWNELLTHEKAFYILQRVFSIATIVFAVLWLQGKGNLAIAEICMGFTMLCEGIYFWRNRRDIAIVSLCAFLVAMILAITTIFF